MRPPRPSHAEKQAPSLSELTSEEVVRKKALERLKRTVKQKKRLLPAPGVLRKVADVPDAARPYLERMRLQTPRTAKEHLLQRVVVYALASIDAI
jgi:hypothetical protein